MVPILWVSLSLSHREKPQAGSVCAFFFHSLSIHILFRYIATYIVYIVSSSRQVELSSSPLPCRGSGPAASEVCSYNGPRIGASGSFPLPPLLSVLFVQPSPLFAPFSIALGLLLFLLCMCLRSPEGCTVSLSPAGRFQGWEVSCHHLPPP